MTCDLCDARTRIIGSPTNGDPSLCPRRLRSEKIVRITKTLDDETVKQREKRYYVIFFFFFYKHYVDSFINYLCVHTTRKDERKHSASRLFPFVLHVFAMFLRTAPVHLEFLL